MSAANPGAVNTDPCPRGSQEALTPGYVYWPSLLDEPRIGQRVEIRHLLDDADFKEQVGGLLAELLELAREELPVRGPILPAQVLLRRLELFARLLDVGAHDLEALLRLLRDQVDRVEVAVGERLRRPRVVGEEFRRTAERVHDHRVIERGRD